MRCQRLPALTADLRNGRFAMVKRRGGHAGGAEITRRGVLAGALRGIPVRLDCGRDDPFIAGNRAFARDLPDATVTFDEGGHNGDYWRAHAGPR